MYYKCTINKEKTYHDCHKYRLNSGETRKDPVKMADVALKVDLALVLFLVLPLYKQSACAKIHAPAQSAPACSS